jgi:hypothetical protein
VDDWTRIAERHSVAEISTPLDRGRQHRQDRDMLTRVAVTVTIAAALTLTGCQGDEQPGAAPSSVQAFPDPPYAAGPIEVTLRPALPLAIGDRRCRPDPAAGRYCAPDGTGGYRALGTARPVEIASVSTAPAADHTSWGTTVRFSVDSRGAVRRARDQAAGFGGVVLVTVGDAIVTVVAPRELTARRAALLGLEKTEAWAAVNAYIRSKQGM